MSDNKVVDLFEYQEKKRENIEKDKLDNKDKNDNYEELKAKFDSLADDDGVIDVDKLPAEIMRRWVLAEHKGTEREKVLFSFATEIEALECARRTAHNWTVFEADVEVRDVLGMKIMYGYTEV